MSDLEKILARHVAKAHRLSTVPVAVIEDVIRHTFDRLETKLDDHTTVQELVGDDWSECECCGDLLRLREVVPTEDGCDFCEACAKQATGVRP